MKPLLLLRPMLRVALFATIFTSCSKIDFTPGNLQKHKKKYFQLKTWTVGSRVYTFYYHDSGLLDSVTAKDNGFSYCYRVTRQNAKLSAVKLVSYPGNNLEGSIDNFQYDNKNRITQYTYHFYASQEEYARNFHYDAKGNLYPDLLQPAPVYNNSGDIESGWLYSFTYDNYLNPLAMIPEISFVMYEDGYWWLYLPKHNSTSITYRNFGDNVFTNRIVNTYDRYGRLLANSEENPPGSPAVEGVFTYY